MAYMNQEKKAKIASELKKVVPPDWKYTLRVQHHSAIIMTIKSAPVDLLADIQWYNGAVDKGHAEANEHHLDRHFAPEVQKTLSAIFDALNLKGQEGANFDKSDPMSDYYHIGYYVELFIGDWCKPFVCTAPKSVATKEVAVESIIDSFAMKFTRNFNAALAR